MLVMVVTMVVCYLVCWLPYGVAALLATFGPRDLITPEASITPSLLAKFSTVINPFIYIFMNKQVRHSRLTASSSTSTPLLCVSCVSFVFSLSHILDDREHSQQNSLFVCKPVIASPGLLSCYDDCYIVSGPVAVVWPVPRCVRCLL